MRRILVSIVGISFFANGYCEDSSDSIAKLAELKRISPDYHIYNREILGTKAIDALNSYASDKNIVGFRAVSLCGDPSGSLHLYDTFILKETCNSMLGVRTRSVSWKPGEPFVDNSQHNYICRYPAMEAGANLQYLEVEDEISKYVTVTLCIKNQMYTVEYDYAGIDNVSNVHNEVDQTCASELFAPLYNRF
ncbi:hypothetical protein AX774_g6606 [Zancudomyces culisetae]|uniref:Uncharacterized protein n=1 Tax=Zancudomyces culisetae TaxID=1213189 RepID=A0A1R1PG64_ZANCU|nr:hypothetical protein AX774_g6606 [Zancudomyces culisetae]|eukprot:OMH79966.1 hypothetical protein AX774_g6606 [Zancudomyces culisetae]